MKKRPKTLQAVHYVSLKRSLIHPKKGLGNKAPLLGYGQTKKHDFKNLR
ncbi:hypothetical protein NEOC65_002235 [Neochlamydia sp. AcF65]|nr:hypothetical protein [Neochlamydia sp. AcF65]MBS4169441.1 hypothetical protein [Neochlamydia sp. AcF95]